MATATQTEFKNYYQTLEIPYGASPEDIKKAFRRLARETHPDTHPGDKSAEARFKQINEAYGVLGDAQKRRDYNKEWQAHRLMGDLGEATRPKQQQSGQAGTRRQKNGLDQGDFWRDLGIDWDAMFGSGAQQQRGQSTRQRATPNFDDLFGDLFGNGRQSARRQGQGQTSRAKDLGNITLPEVDAGLLAALVRAIREPNGAYSTVLRPESDIRRPHLKNAYVVYGGVNNQTRLLDIRVFVDLESWRRYPEDKGKPLQIRNSEGVTKIRNTSYFDVAELKRGESIEGISNKPGGWTQYIDSLKVIAADIVGAGHEGTTVAQAKATVAKHLTDNAGYYGIDANHHQEPSAYRNGLGLQRVSLSDRAMRGIERKRVTEFRVGTPEGRHTRPTSRAQRA